MAVNTDFAHRIADDLQIGAHQVRAVIELVQDGCTVPFITRYRKERTGELQENAVRAIIEQYSTLEQLESRRSEILQSIAAQERLTPELEARITQAQRLSELEDLYLPYRPKRRTRASVARERGLEPLAQAVLAGDPLSPEFIQTFIDPDNDISGPDDALAGAMDIIAEQVAEDAAVRALARQYLGANAQIECRKRRIAPDDSPYTQYYDYSESLAQMPPHRTLAINRAEREDCIRIRLSYDADDLDRRILHLMLQQYPHADRTRLELAISDGAKRLLVPSLETELRSDKTREAEAQAVGVFGENLRNLLLSPPISKGAVLGIDPAYRTGCKVAVVDLQGRFLESTSVYPVPPRQDRQGAARELQRLIRAHDVALIAIGNGTASAETQEFIGDFIAEQAPGVQYLIVNEAGASVYSVSQAAQEEFPDLDATVRGAISIARRALDPLAELVKIDPKSIGVGQYQHDVNQKFLGDKLRETVESVVNYVGVNLNTASAHLLSFVSGISATVARNILEYREQIGQFRSREQLLQVSRLGPATYVQCAGFLRIPNAPDILDNTGVHPESYPVARQLLEQLGLDHKQLGAQEPSSSKLRSLAEQLQCGLPTLRDIIADLGRPGRDPREELEPPLLRSASLRLEDLQEGDQLEGVVRNVVDFGAFVDVGLKNDGLVHISEMADRFVRNPHEVLAVGDRVRARVISIDQQRGRIGLSLRHI